MLQYRGRTEYVPRTARRTTYRTCSLLLLIALAVGVTGCTRAPEQNVQMVEFLSGHYPKGSSGEGISARWAANSTSVLMNLRVKRGSICEVFVNGTFSVSGQDIRVNLINGTAHECMPCPHRTKAQRMHNVTLGTVVQNTLMRLPDTGVNPGMDVRVDVAIYGNATFTTTLPARAH